MYTISDISDKQFTLNSIPYWKNYIPSVYGNKLIIHSVYDRNDEKTELSDVSQFLIDGAGFTDLIELQAALLPVLYNRDFGGGSQLYTSYVALMNYSAPSNGTILTNATSGSNCVKVLHNNLGATVAIEKTATGAITISNDTGAFIAGKTAFSLIGINASLGYNFDISSGNINVLMLSSSSNSASDGLAPMTDVLIDIKIYN